MNTKTKIGIAVAIIIIAIVVIYFVLKGKKTNKFASAATLSNLSTGIQGYTDIPGTDPNYMPFYNALVAAFGVHSDGSGSESEYYTRAWLKGFNLAMRAENVNKFKTDIGAYIADTANRKPHWEITVGQFLNQ